MNKLITTLAANNGVVDITPVSIGDGNQTGDNLVPAVTSILNVIIGALGIVCVAIVIFGGVQYMTSTGDSGKVKKAKDTILYGIIGLVICALAAVIVNFVIAKVLGA